MNNKKPIITLCSSVNFYKELVRIQADLEELGYTAIVPKTATVMKESGDFEVSHYKTWFGNADDYHKKTALMRGHFNEVTKANAILVLNNEKHGRSGYIGGNVLMEMALAFHLNIPIYVFNPVDPESPFTEEIIGMGSIVINGDLNRIQH